MASFPIALSCATSLAFQGKGLLVTTHMPGHISLNLALLKITEGDLTYHTIILVQSCKLQDKPMVLFPQDYCDNTWGKKKKPTTKKKEIRDWIRKQKSGEKNLGVLR